MDQPTATKIAALVDQIKDLVDSKLKATVVLRDTDQEGCAGCLIISEDDRIEVAVALVSSASVCARPSFDAFVMSRRGEELFKAGTHTEYLCGTCRMPHAVPLDTPLRARETYKCKSCGSVGLVPSGGHLNG